MRPTQTSKNHVERAAERKSERLLVIRFSSFGDIVQAAGVPAAFKAQYPAAAIDWLVRSDFRSLLVSHPAISTVIAFDRREGVLSLLNLAWRLGGEPYTHIYDAHNNVRSLIVSAVITIRRLKDFKRQPLPRFIRRSKDRVRRFLFFKVRQRWAIRMPFRGAESFLRPLRKWNLDARIQNGPQFYLAESEIQAAERTLGEFQPDIALVPSAAWEMKRWPIEYWKELITLLPEKKFVVLGGPEDSFCEELVKIAPERVLNLAGRLNLPGSSAILKLAKLTISNDTGLLHVADQMGRPLIALIGPTAFGYPSHVSAETLEVELPCKPCSKDGRGVCVNPIYKKCLLDVTPTQVASRARLRLESLNENGASE